MHIFNWGNKYIPVGSHIKNEHFAIGGLRSHTFK